MPSRAEQQAAQRRARARVMAMAAIIQTDQPDSLVLLPPGSAGKTRAVGERWPSRVVWASDTRAARWLTCCRAAVFCADGVEDVTRQRAELAAIFALGTPQLPTGRVLQGPPQFTLGDAFDRRAEAAAAPPPSGDAHRVRVLRAEGFASDVKALSKRVQDEGVRSEFARFFVTKQQADELGRPSLETSHMPCDPGAHRAGHQCTKDCLLRLMVFQEDWLAHAAPVAERLAAARGVPRRMSPRRRGGVSGERGLLAGRL